MSRIRNLGLVVATLLLVGVPLMAHAETKVFKAHLTGEQVVPARVTQANGQAHFAVSQDQAQVEFRVTVANIENVVAAHIFLGAPGENGAIVATLYGPVAAAGGKKAGVLATGTITASNLVGSLAGRPMSELIAAMKAGTAYVSVLTDDGQGAPDEKPGDFSTGEIRGQIQ
jgi:CHRD domain-containing protein